MMRMGRPALAALIFVLSGASISQLGSAQSVAGAITGSATTTHSVAVPAIHPIIGVTNRPYSATVKTTFVQKLADGTTITKVSTTKEARDSEGRSMHQISLAPPNVEPAMLETGHGDALARTTVHAAPAARRAWGWRAVGKGADP
jgi:hypothetical protein